MVLVPKLVLRPAIPVEEASTNNTCRDGSRIGTPIAVSPNLFSSFFKMTTILKSLWIGTVARCREQHCKGLLKIGYYQ